MSLAHIWPFILVGAALVFGLWLKFRKPLALHKRWQWAVITDAGPADGVMVAKLDRKPTRQDLDWVKHEIADGLARLTKEYGVTAPRLHGLRIAEVPNGTLTGTSGSAYDQPADRAEIETRRWLGPEGLEHEVLRAAAHRRHIPGAGGRNFD